MPPPVSSSFDGATCFNVLILESQGLLGIELEDNLLDRGVHKHQIFYAGVPREAYRQANLLLAQSQPLLVIANSALVHVDDGLPVLQYLLSQRPFGPMFDVIAISHSGVARARLKELKVTRILEKIPVFKGETQQLNAHLDEIQGILCRSAA